jgi:predicted TIM-barrel fold metal-dependent hydrolase
VEAGNALTASWFEREPRAYGLIVVNPLRQNESLAQIERYAEHPRFVGLKTIQDFTGTTLDDPLYEPFLVKAAAQRLPLLAHMPGMDKAARRHPEVTFVAAHANWGRAQRFIEIPNVCFDFSTGHALRHETQLARFIRAVGARRVLYGSDGQLVSPAWSLSKLLQAGLEPAEENLILRENAYRVFPKLGQER